MLRIVISALGIELAMATVAAVAVLILVGSMLQSAVGFGFALIAAPLLALFAPDLVPSVLLLLALPLTSTMAFRGWPERDRVGLVPVLVGRLIGTGMGVWLLLMISRQALSLVVGLVVIVAVVSASIGPTRRPGLHGLCFAGVASGFMGTTAATGGPPLALAYQSASGPQMRATLAILFFVGNVISIGALLAVGAIGRTHVLWAVGMSPVLFVGLSIGTALAKLLDELNSRAAALAICFAAGLVASAKGLADLGLFE